jgi:hypothetical protein
MSAGQARAPLESGNSPEWFSKTGGYPAGCGPIKQDDTISRYSPALFWEMFTVSGTLK